MPATVAPLGQHIVDRRHRTPPPPGVVRHHGVPGTKDFPVKPALGMWNQAERLDELRGTPGRTRVVGEVSGIRGVVGVTAELRSWGLTQLRPVHRDVTHHTTSRVASARARS